MESFAVCKSSGGGLAVFGVGPAAQPRYRFQSKPFSDWTEWADLKGHANSIVAQASYVGGLEVFVIDPSGEVRHKWRDRLDVPWTEWITLDREPSPLRS